MSRRRALMLTKRSFWQDVQRAVRNGTAPKLFPVGYEFEVYKEQCGMITFRVLAHNHHKTADSKLTNTMTLEMKYVYGNSSAYKPIMFNPRGALYYAEKELPAGTYNFTLLKGYNNAYGGGKTLSFTITKPIPKGGSIVFQWGYQQQATDTNIITYENSFSNAEIETVPVVESTDGVSLGVADGTTPNINHTQRLHYGSNNYAQSALRQWLNSDAKVGSVWKPQTIFDRPPSWHTSIDNAYDGFMNGLDKEFIDVVQPAIILCRTNSAYETDSLDETKFSINQTYVLNDKFFVLSHPEIYGTWDNNTLKDGELLEFYEDLASEEIKKYDAFGSARNAWLRSPYPANAQNEYSITNNGTLNGSAVINTNGVAAACIIA